jgi:peptidoglycan/xylan/chitin deacetylase (PgdA/CDA1 family)
VTILCYHAVEDDWPAPMSVQRAAFESQARWLAQHRRVLPLAEAVSRLGPSGRLARGECSLTFDDGFVSVFDYAFATLARYRLPATVFLVAETLTPAGRAVDWVDSPPSFPLRTMTLEQVLAMQDAGVQFGSHSYSHLDLTTLSYQDCVSDLTRSRTLLEDLLGRPVPFLAYPRGRHDEHVRRAAERAGFAYAFTLPESGERVGPLAVPRVGIHRGNSLSTLRLKSSRAYLPLRTSRLFPLAARVVKQGPARRGNPRSASEEIAGR